MFDPIKRFEWMTMYDIWITLFWKDRCDLIWPWAIVDLLEACEIDENTTFRALLVNDKIWKMRNIVEYMFAMLSRQQEQLSKTLWWNVADDWNSRAERFFHTMQIMKECWL